jgi:hypothetical protein
VQPLWDRVWPPRDLNRILINPAFGLFEHSLGPMAFMSLRMGANKGFCMRVLIVFLLLFCTATIDAAERTAFCEDSPMDIFPDEYFNCEARQSFKKGFDKHALGLFKRASRWGSKQAQYKVGLMLVAGFGTRRDPVEGAAWLLLANERNNRAVTEQLKLTMAELDESGRQAANARALELREEYGDYQALERRAQSVRRMKRRTTGSHLGRPMATVSIVGSQGRTADQALSRLDRYETSLRNVLTSVEYRDFKVLEPGDEGQANVESSKTKKNENPD